MSSEQILSGMGPISCLIRSVTSGSKLKWYAKGRASDGTVIEIGPYGNRADAMIAFCARYRRSSN